MAYYELDEPAVERHKKAWYNAMGRLHMLSDGCNPWKHVTGRATACVLSLLRIHWKPANVEGWKKWTNTAGEEIDISWYPPYSIREWLREDIEKELWRLSTSNHDGDESGVWLKPLRAAVLNGTNPQHGASTRSVAIGTQWTQSRLASAGYAAEGDDKCRLCNRDAGTLWHRHMKEGCPRMQEHRALLGRVCRL